MPLSQVQPLHPLLVAFPGDSLVLVTALLLVLRAQPLAWDGSRSWGSVSKCGDRSGGQGPGSRGLAPS